MSKTAIVPVQPFDEPWDDLTREQLSFRAKWIAHVYARPPVPDELIEEAAQEIFWLARGSRVWFELTDSEKESFRDMARAAARVFNGGKDE